MKKRECAICKQLYYSDCAIELEGKEFCTDKCLKKYYLKRIEDLENSVKNWKEAWFEMREIVGRLGSKFMIPDSYKKDNNLLDFETPYVAQIDIGNIKITCPCHHKQCNKKNEVVELHELLDSNM